MIKTNRGFTLVELVVSIFVLAIVIVVAVPKMVDQNKLEEQTTVDQAAGYFGSAVSLGHAAWVVAGRPGAAVNLPGFRQGTFDFNADGWPIGVGANKSDGMDPLSCVKLWADIQDFELSATTQSAGEDADFIASSEKGECLYKLSANTSRIIRYNTNTGKILVTNI